jgi:peptidoglycan/xylan/chitin deacetylase (PgdA/CDA1 family)
MDNLRFNVLPIVLHRLVLDGDVQRFDDFEVSSFSKVLDFCRQETLFKNSSGATSLHDQKIVITFDDGHLTDVTIALPALSAANCYGTFFIATSLIGKPGYMNWNQVRELHCNGMSIGSHSTSHTNMCKLNKDLQKKELIESKKRIEDQIGYPINAFSFPFGKFNADLMELAKSSGYQFVFTSQHGLARRGSTVFPRNSLNSRMSHPKIIKTLEAGIMTRLNWMVEDNAKAGARALLGDRLYRKYRDYLMKAKND